MTNRKTSYLHSNAAADADGEHEKKVSTTFHYFIILFSSAIFFSKYPGVIFRLTGVVTFFEGFLRRRQRRLRRWRQRRRLQRLRRRRRLSWFWKVFFPILKWLESRLCWIVAEVLEVIWLMDFLNSLTVPSTSSVVCSQCWPAGFKSRLLHLWTSWPELFVKVKIIL